MPDQARSVRALGSRDRGVAVDWFRFYHEAIDDPKVQLLPPPVFKAWVNVLCIASRNTPRGTLPQEAETAFQLRIDITEARKILTALRVAGLLDGDTGETLQVHGWNGRQMQSDNSVPRVKKHRSTVTRTVTETPAVTTSGRCSNGDSNGSSRTCASEERRGEEKRGEQQPGARTQAGAREEPAAANVNGAAAAASGFTRIGETATAGNGNGNGTGLGQGTRTDTDEHGPARTLAADERALGSAVKLGYPEVTARAAIREALRRESCGEVPAGKIRSLGAYVVAMLEEGWEPGGNGHEPADDSAERERGRLMLEQLRAEKAAKAAEMAVACGG